MLQKELNTHIHIKNVNGILRSSIPGVDEDAFDFSDVAYYADQTDNMLFMSMKEELMDNIHKAVDEYEDAIEKEKSVYKKKLYQKKLKDFRKLGTNFKNTWECYDFNQAVFNNGNILSDERIEEVKKIQKDFIRHTKESLGINKMLSKPFMAEYVYVSMFNPLYFSIVAGIISSNKIWIDFQGGISEALCCDSFFYTIECGLLTWVLMLVALAYWVIKAFITSKVIALCFKSKTKEPEQILKENVKGISHSVVKLGILRKLFK